MDIAALKQQARTLEQQGDAAGALATYRKILDQVEGTRAVLGELPLYVKVGDLLLKQRHAKDAVAMYDRAARLYAQHGSSKSVLALCGRILTVSRQATSVYVRYADLMVRTGHVADACTILQRYAEKVELPKLTETLQAFAGRSDDDAKYALEMLIEVAEQAERLKRILAAQAGQLRAADEARAAAPPDRAGALSEPSLEEPGEAAPPAATGEEPLQKDELLSTPDQAESLVAHGAEAGSVDGPEPLVVHGFDPVPPDEAPVETPEEAVYDSVAPGGAEVPASYEPRYKEYAPDSRPRQDADPAAGGSARSKLWLALAIIIVVGAAAGLVYFGVIP